MGPSPAVLALAANALAARYRNRDAVVETPCLISRDDRFAGSDLIFKCENFQTTGSFKLRGAISKLSTLPVTTPLITASSGNHGIACGHAAQIIGHDLRVVLPETVAKAKLAQIERYGAKPILYAGDSGLAERHARAVAADKGYVYVSPYNDNAIMAGQGTIALELLEQVPRFDRVYVSMGGGGLISGIGAVLKTCAPEIEVVGVSAENSGALAASLKAGHVVDTEHLPTLADGCAGGMDHDSLTFPIAREVIDRVVHCSEEQIEDALRHLAWTENLLVEGAAALALAAYMSEPDLPKGQTNVVLLCGANFDSAALQPILTQDTSSSDP
ncbi:pyridoxal-phosphate dependent enzyme [uncultured Roseobacter sp.]|uniref:threonine ammonia-lyase n=1 Tax=uncultured Roseobacter sp. TaxID=114847 RepID=UPI0026072934|nr:pyridoxal-phosphate dependent enzyme [uncultured Roseobacter sp.]